MCDKNTRIVEITGGLGNQMFQFAFGKHLEHIYPEDKVIYDCEYYDASNSIRTYSLEEAFGINLPLATKKDVRKVRGYNPYDSIIEKTISKISSIFYCDVGYEIVENLDVGVDDNNVSSSKDTYYCGYWQSERYFKPFRAELVSDFSFNSSCASEEYNQFTLYVSKCNSVALHVRLEDYLNEKNYKIYGDICTFDYYAKAIDYISKTYGECTFFVFSTDLDTSMNFLPKGHKYIPIVYTGQKDYLDMYLMTRCKHNIIANSTFSWWGAWLNGNKQKTVICPNRWFNNHDVYNQYCEGWIKM